MALAQLALDWRSGTYGVTPCTAYRLLNGVPTQIGNTFSSSNGFNTGWAACSNRIIQFGGDLYAVGRDGVYKLPSGSSTWSLTGGITFTNPSAVDYTTRTRSGIHVVMISGVPYLVGTFNDTTGRVGYRKNLVTGTVNQTQSGSTDRFFETAVFQGKMHFGNNNSSGTAIWDPSAQSFSTVSHSSARASYEHRAFCAFNESFFCLSMNSSGTYQIEEYSGGAWVLRASLVAAGATPQTNIARLRLGLFTDGTNLYAFVPYDSGGTTGLRCYQITSGFTASNITTTVLPTALRCTSDGGSGYGTVQAALPIHDTEAVSGSDTVYVSFNSNMSSSSQPYDLYEWNGNSSLMTFVGSGGASVIDMAGPGCPSGGPRIWTSGEMDVYISELAKGIGGQLVKMIPLGGGAVADKKLKLFYATDGGPALSQATLIGTATGGLAERVGNELQNVAANGTEYSITWDFEEDGVALGDWTSLRPEVSI